MILLEESINRFGTIAESFGQTGLRPNVPGSEPRDEIEALRRALAPARLPEELESWWAGWDPTSAAFVEASAFRLFTPAVALESWEFCASLDFPRALLPICDEEKRMLAIEVSTSSHPGSRLFEIDFHGEYLTMLGVGVSGLIDLISESLERSHASSVPNPYPGPINCEIYSDVIREAEQSFGSVRVDSHQKSVWPQHWLDEEGFTEEWLRPRGRTHRVADFDVARESTWPLSGVLQGVWRTRISGGGLNGSVGRLTDGSGWVQVFVPFDIPHAGVGPDGQCEMEVVGVPETGNGVGSLPGGCEALAAVLAGEDAVTEWLSHLREMERQLDVSIVVTAVRPLS